MSISLIKEREEKVKVCLKKKFKPETDIRAKVNFIVDVSGSMSTRFRTGKVQSIIERIFPIASVMNDVLGSYIFSSIGWCSNKGYRKLNPVTISNYGGYVQSQIINNGYVDGGTDYAPVINEIVKDNKGTEIPVYNIFITDGDNSDKAETSKILLESSGEKIFWMFVGIGNQSFDFLIGLDDMTGRVNDNADFFAINDLESINDEELYNRLFEEFPAFVENFKSEPYKSPQKEKKKGFFGRLFG